MDIGTAARQSDLATVKQILADCPEAIFSVNSVGFNALHQALIADNCGNVNAELVRFLVEAGCPINQLSQDGRTPLWIAAEFCPDVEVVQYLIEQGADLSLLIRNGCHIVDAIDNLSEQKVVQRLLSQLTQHPIPTPPPPPKYPDVRADTAIWRKTTAAIKKAFLQLEKSHNMIALPNASYTVDECVVECVDKRTSMANSSEFDAYCFYTEPNKDRARESGTLYLHYGLFDAENETRLIQIAENIIATMQEHGFETEWSGQTKDCIIVWLQPFYQTFQAAF
ncbi:MAG: ankyrin repeat domain-containing protein [Alysiella sp.]|uniref:ankyrin repeat domain-containing protein n=1 Tax=Alysiella sp. TaxID=1872483 RepID=UPI0026DC2091|nr:ankyrin repeat domain-containing protein [Alysiella sp.]MDO4433897.1 ankyrin repeat domain-containing protein [Alysiella sp.]